MTRARILSFIPFVLTFVLFLVPFFWLPPGEMDLGGDSSRLYFYAPLTYLKTHLLYNTILSGIGGTTLSYFAIPYVLMLAGLRALLSPTFVIAVSQGTKLALAFLSCYLIVKELLSHDDRSHSRVLIEGSSLLSGLFFVFSPIIVNSGWDRAILTHTQVFVYPLMFYLMLRYLTTKAWGYLVGMLLVSYIFSINFSFFAAPGFFTFFPLSFVYLVVYVRFIRRTTVPWKGLMLGILVFLLIQSFHVIPHIMGLFVSGEFAGVFSEESIIVRGLDYFLGIAPNIKVSVGFFNLAQMRKITVASLVSIVFPWVMVGGLLVKKRVKRYLLYLTMGTFLVTLFFETANITQVGFTFYKYLFYIPGFKMFRNFFAQWSMVFVFYYMLVIGLSLPWVLRTAHKAFRYAVPGLMLLALGLGAYPLLSGKMVNDIHFQTKGTKQNIRMDPVFEQVVAAVGGLPVDGKILSLPLVGPGYQLFAGAGGTGVYMGPSLFSYLAGRNDFTGFDGMAPYGQTFLDAALRRQWQRIARLFSLLNIKYVFYNPDPAIYEQNFPKFPYDFVTKFLPKTQEGYKAFLPNLPIDTANPFTIGRYVLYPVKDESYLPHVFTSSRAIYTNFPDQFALNEPLYPNINDTILPIYAADQTVDNVILEAEPSNPFRKFLSNIHFHKHAPFLSVQMGDLQYPLVVIKEKLDLLRAKRSHERYFNLSFLFLAKRIFELERWGDTIPIVGKPQKPPRLRDVFKPGRYNSWEAALARYEEATGWAMQWIRESNPTEALIEADTLKAKEQIDQHRKRLLSKLKERHLKDSEIIYLRAVVEAMFDRIYARLGAKIYDMSVSYYTLKVPSPQSGEYEAIVQFADDVKAHEPYQIIIGDQTITGTKGEERSSLGFFENTVTVPAGTMRVEVRFTPTNILTDASWINSGFAQTKDRVSSLSLTNISNDYIDGLVKEIPGWRGDAQYMITFEYDTHGEYFLYRMFDKWLVDEEAGLIRTNIFFEKNLHSQGWKTQQTLVSANELSKSAYLQFLIESNNTSGRLDVRNVSVVRIDNPHVFLRKKSYGTASGWKPPRIVFRKINPTKYQVDVSGAASPYLLVFLEAFSPHWQFVDAEKKATGVASQILRTLGMVYSAIGSRLGASYTGGDQIVATHMDGAVTEKVHTYSSLDPRNFASWGNASIAKKQHFPAYGYGNAWIVRPEDMDYKKTYTLYIEVANQKDFYLFFTLSAVGVAGIIGWSVFRFIRRLSYAHPG